MTDQATNLRLLAQERAKKNSENFHVSARTLAIVSGKGGVGKSTLSLYLAFYLAQLKQTVLLVDANLHSPALHVMLNQTPTPTLQQLMDRSADIQSLKLAPLYPNLYFIPNTETAGYPPSNQPDAVVFRERVAAIGGQFSYIIFDTHTGLNNWNVNLLQSTDENIVLSFSDPTAIIDTYVYIKNIKSVIPPQRFSLLINQVFTKNEGAEAFEKLNLALSHFLKFKLALRGIIPLDTELRKANLQQSAPWHNSCNTMACHRIRELAISINNEQLNGSNNKTQKHERKEVGHETDAI